MSKTMRTPPKNSPKQNNSFTADKPNKRPRPNTSPQTNSEISLNKQEEMISMLTQVLVELSEMRKANAEIQKSLEFYVKNCEDLKERIKLLDEEKQQRENYMNKLEYKLEDLERQTKSSSIEIRGIPPVQGETKTDLINYMEKIYSKINVQPPENVIKDLYRINRKPTGERPIVVEYTTNIFKNKILQAVKKYNASNTTNRLNTNTLGIEGNRAPVFVSEQLTPKAKRLYFLARDAAKQSGYNFCWTTNGKVLLRKTEGAAPIVIVSEKHLEELKQKN